MPMASMITPVTLKSRLTVTKGHWKRNHWVDHTRLTIKRVIGRWILSWPWNMGQRSLNVIEISAIRKLGCCFLFAFYSNYGRICSRLWDIQCQRMASLENQVMGRSRSLKMAPFDRPYATFYWSAIANIALSCTIFKLFDIEQYCEWPWNLAYRSLKVIETGAIQKRGCGFLFAFYSNYRRICSRLWDI